MTKTLMEALLAASRHEEDLTGIAKMQAVALSTSITRLVRFLAIDLPNEPVNRLLGQVWHLIGSRTVVTAMYKEVSTPHFAIVGQGSEQAWFILFPPDWIQQIATSPTHAMGALVFCGSQAVDAYNDRAIGQKDALQARSLAYEAEYLLTLQSADPVWVPNAYQAKVLEEFPLGVRSAQVVDLWYEPKPPPESPPFGFSA